MDPGKVVLVRLYYFFLVGMIPILNLRMIMILILNKPPPLPLGMIMILILTVADPRGSDNDSHSQ